MRQYVIRRVAFGALSAVLVSLLIFALLRIAPGDVAMMIAAERSGGEGAQLTAEQIDQIREQLGLKAPLYVQYGQWMGGFLSGDWGRSLWNKLSVFGEFKKKFAVTLELVILAQMLAITLGLFAGVVMALRRDTWVDYVVRILSLAGLSVPSFWSATLFLVGAAYFFHWNPRIDYVPFLKEPVANLKQFIWPAIMLGYISAATQARMMRSTMLEVLRQDYIRTAHAKGLAASVVTFRHALKNALIPVITLIGLQISVALGGSVVIERIFGLPGIGSYLIDGMLQRDYPVVQSLVTFFSGAIVLINLLVDLSYGWLDPRIRYQ